MQNNSHVLKVVGLQLACTKTPVTMVTWRYHGSAWCTVLFTNCFALSDWVEDLLTYTRWKWILWKALILVCTNRRETVIDRQLFLLNLSGIIKPFLIKPVALLTIVFRGVILFQKRLASQVSPRYYSLIYRDLSRTFIGKDIRSWCVLAHG